MITFFSRLKVWNLPTAIITLQSLCQDGPIASYCKNIRCLLLEQGKWPMTSENQKFLDLKKTPERTGFFYQTDKCL